MAGDALQFVQNIHDWNYMIVSRGERIVEVWTWKTYISRIRQNIPGQLSSLGVLIAIALSFNSINKERIDGNLKVLLSYPIHRDQVILGKLIAGAAVVSLATVASIMVALTLHLYMNNLYLKPDLVLRFGVFTALSVLFLWGYLGLSMLLSIAFKDQKTTLLAMFVIIGLFNSPAFLSYGRILSDTIYGPELHLDPPCYPLNPEVKHLQDFIAKLSTSFGYERTSTYLQHHSTVVYKRNEYMWIPSNVWSALRNNLYSTVILAILLVLTYVLSYMLFTRKEIA